MSKSEKSVFLDVDASLVENNLRFTGNDEDEELTKFLGQQAYPSKVVKPVPGFCVKTKEVGSDTKVFVNICKTDAIPPPKEITVDELRVIIESDDPGEYKVPMSIGEIRTEKDKKDQEAKTIDIAVHPTFFDKVENVPEFKSFFMAVVFQGLENKYGLICADEKIILLNRKAFGTLQLHRIQQREVERKMADAQPKSLVTGEAERKKVVIETLSSTENVFKEPEYRLYRKKSGHNYLYGEFKLPENVSAKNIVLDIGEDRILLEGTSRGYLLDMFVPYIIKQKSCSATFDKSTRILTVTMPLVGG